MIFDLTQNYTPESYVDSRDYRVFLRQLSFLITVFKYNIDHYPDLYDADECPDNLLGLLAEMVGYHYSDERSVNGNRKIIKNFPYLLRNRGSELGITLAAVLSINTNPYVDKTYSLENIIVSVDVENGLITIYHPKADLIDWKLIEVVRPVGMRVRLVPAGIGESVDELDLKVTARAIVRDEYYDESKVDESNVNYDTTKITRSDINE